MKSLEKFRNVFLILFSLVLFTSCSSVMLVGDSTAKSIDSVGDFLGVYIMLQLSIFIMGVLLSFFLGGFGYVVSVIAHFIWVVSERDYGFFTVLLLFSLASIVSFLLNILVALIKSKN